MEPQIRYVRTSDGINIATQRLGEGTLGVPLVIAPPYAFSAAMVDWTVHDFQTGLTTLATRRLVVNYDPRGFGLSDRAFTDLGLEERVADLAAVVDSCGPEVNILTRGPASLYAIAYAARNPDRVRRMIMSAGYARGRDFRLNRDRWALTRLMEENFDFYLQASALADFGWDDGKQFARDIGRHLSRDALQASFRANRQIDVTSDGTNWVRVETVGPTGSEVVGGWIFHSFIVTDFVPLSATVRVRFRASDLGLGSLVEAAIDDPRSRTAEQIRLELQRAAKARGGFVKLFLLEGDLPQAAVCIGHAFVERDGAAEAVGRFVQRS